MTSLNEKVSITNNSSAKAKGKGTVCVKASTKRLIRFKDTLFVPESRNNLLSKAKMTDVGNTVKFYSTHAIIKDEKTGKVVCTADRLGDLYYINEERGEQALATRRQFKASQMT